MTGGQTCALPIYTLIADELARYRVAPHLLEIEITETIWMGDNDAAIKTLHALQDLNGAGTVQTLVDNEIAVQNLTRLAESKGCSITTEKRSDKEFCVTITTENSIGKTEADEQIACTVPAAQKKTVVVISADHMGEGDDELGRIEAETLVLWTTHDPTAPVSVGERLASLVKRSRMVVMENCGHWPQYEDPDTFNTLHIDFLLNG